MGPGCGGGPARRRASRTAAGMASARSAPPKAAPGERGPLAQPLVVGERVTLQVGIEQQGRVRVALAGLPPDRGPHEPVCGRPPQRAAHRHAPLPVRSGTPRYRSPGRRVEGAPAGTPEPVRTSVSARGPVTPDEAWERYADLDRWPGGAPQISGIDAGPRRLESGLTGVVR